MRVLILTCLRREIASRCLPALCANPALTVAGVVLAHGGSPGASRRLWRKLRKTIRIGPLGAWNGIRMREWYRDPDAEDIEELCARHGVRFLETGYLNCDRTREHFRELGADLGLSLGNGYIAESVFSLPRYGMVNVHSEILPDYQGAQSIIWPIHDGVPFTGFTLHQVAKRIDAGDILYQERYPIEFRPTLRETVEHNMRRARERLPAAVALVSERYEELRARAISQPARPSFTTPTLRQFRRMVANNATFFEEAKAKGNATMIT